MTLPQNVKDAVAQLDSAMMFHADDLSYASWQTIRAHLLSQESEIERLTSRSESAERDCRECRRIQIEDSVRAELAESRLAAANALLQSEAALLRAWARESRDGGWSTHQYDPMLRRANELDTHLQGAGDEA